MFHLKISWPNSFAVSSVHPNLTSVSFSLVFIFHSLFFFFFSFYYSIEFLVFIPVQLFRSENLNKYLCWNVCCFGMLMRFLGFSLSLHDVRNCLCVVYGREYGLGFSRIIGNVLRILTTFSYAIWLDKLFYSVTLDSLLCCFVLLFLFSFSWFSLSL